MQVEFSTRSRIGREAQIRFERFVGRLKPVDVLVMRRARGVSSPLPAGVIEAEPGDYNLLHELKPVLDNLFSRFGGMSSEIVREFEEGSDSNGKEKQEISMLFGLQLRPGKQMTHAEFVRSALQVGALPLAQEITQSAKDLDIQLSNSTRVMQLMPFLQEGFRQAAVELVIRAE
jgi:hypothetical protein